MSADGLEYAFVAPDGGGFGPGPMYVVNSASGAETQFTLPSAGVQAYWAVLDFSPPLVWLVTSYSTVSRLDLRTGTVTPTNISAPVWEVDKQVAWVGSVNPSDPNPQQGFAGSQSDQVDRVTLSGSRETWIYRASMALRVVGLDGHGSPIVWAYKSPSGGQSLDELLLITAPNSARTIATGELASAVPTAIDSHGVWFAGKDGIYLLPDGGALEKVSDVVATPAGGCE